MTSGRAGRRALVRIAWRQARLERTGTLLLVAVVALLTGGLGVAAVLWESGTMSASGYLARVLGTQAGAYVEQVATDPVAQTTATGRWHPLAGDEAGQASLVDVLSDVGRGEAVLAHQDMVVLVADDRSTEPVVADQLDAPAAFAVRDVEGRMPRSADEAALAVDLARRLVVDVGDTVDVLSGDLERSVTLTGVMASGTVSQGQILLGPQALGDPTGAVVAYLPVASELSAQDVRLLNQAGAVVTGRAGGWSDALHPPSDADLGGGPQTNVWLVLVVPVATALCLGLLLLPAFAVRAVRQQRLNGLLLSVGANDRAVTAVASAYAVGVALVGLVAGLGVGLLAASLVLLRASGGFGSQVLVPWPILALLAVGVVGGAWLSGVLSGRRTRRVSVSRLVGAGLGEQEAPTTRRRPYLVGALAIVTVGVSVAAVMSGNLGFGGLAAGLVGVLVIVLVPAAVDLVDRWVGRGPVTVRIAVRSLFRYRRRSVAGVRVVAAGALAVTCVSVAVGGMAAVTSAEYRAAMPDGAVEVVLGTIPGVPYDEERAQDAAAAVAAAAGHEPAATARVMDPGAEEPVSLGASGYVAWPEELPLLDEVNARFLAADHAGVAQDAARQGRAVVGDGQILDGGVLTLGLAGAQVQVPATELGDPSVFVVGIPPGVATELGQPTRLRSVYFDDLGAEQSDLDRIRAAAVRAVGSTMSVRVYVEDGPEAGEELRTLAGVTAGLAVVSTFVSLLISLLTSAESRREWEIMNANGASVRQLRRVAAVLAGSVALVGGLLGVLGGLAASGVIAAQYAGEPWAFRPPWLAVGLLVVVVPLVCAAASGLTSFRRDVRRVTPRHR